MITKLDHITRLYNAKMQGVQAIQLEMTRGIYKTEGPPFTLRKVLAAKVTTIMRAM